MLESERITFQTLPAEFDVSQINIDPDVLLSPSSQLNGEDADRLREKEEYDNYQKELSDNQGDAVANGNGTMTRFTTGERSDSAFAESKQAKTRIGHVLATVDRQVKEMKEESDSDSWLDKATDTVTGLFNKAGGFVSTNIFTPVREFFERPLGSLNDAVSSIGDGIGSLYKDSALEQSVNSIKNSVSEAYENSWADRAVENVVDFSANAVNVAEETYEGSWLQTGVRETKESIGGAYENSWLESGVDRVQGWFGQQNEDIKIVDAPQMGISAADKVNGPLSDISAQTEFSGAASPEEVEPEVSPTPQGQGPTITHSNNELHKDLTAGT